MKRLAIVMSLACALTMAGPARAGDFSTATGGTWNTNTEGSGYGQKDTWGAGIAPTGLVNPPPDPIEAGVYFPFSGDTATINAGHEIVMNGRAACCGWNGMGVDAFPADLEIRLNGGQIRWQTSGLGSTIINSPIMVMTDSRLASTVGADDGCDLRGNISDFAPGTTGKITVDSVDLDLALSGDNSAFTGGWDIGSNHLWFGAWRPVPPAGGDTIMGTGDIASNGGGLRYHFDAGTINNNLTLGDDGLFIEDGRNDLGQGWATLAGLISGTGALTVDGAYTDHLKVTNPANSYNGLVKSGIGSCVVTALGAQGAGTITVLAGTLKLDDPADATTWSLANGLGGSGTIQVEDGSAGRTLTTTGAVAPGASAGTLTVAGAMAFGAGSSLDIEIVGVWTDHDQNPQTPDILTDIAGDQLAVQHGLSGLANATLNFANIDVTLEETFDMSKTYTIVTSATDLPAAGERFGAVVHPGKWGGPVDYNADGSVTCRFTVMGDADLSGDVTLADLSALAFNWEKASGALWSEGDFTYDGAVTLADLSALAFHWEDTVAAGAPPVPEPCSLALLALGAAAVIRRRRS